MSVGLDCLAWICLLGLWVFEARFRVIVCLAVLSIWWCLCWLVCLDDLGLVSGLTIAGFGVWFGF